MHSNISKKNNNRQVFLKKQRVLIMGLGLNDGGAGAARFFLKQGADVLITDLKSKKELLPSVKKLLEFKREYGKRCGRLRFVLGHHRKNDFKDADLIIQGPGIPNNSPFLAIARKNKIPIDTDIGIFFENCPSPIIGVTGSKGKSTTAALIYNILKQKFKDVILAGNIGKSPLDYINKIKPTTKIVLELSSWQLEGLDSHKKSPNIAVVTNILREHLNRYESFGHYASAKALIFKYQKKGDYLIISGQAERILKKELAYLNSTKLAAPDYAFLKQHPVLLKRGRHNMQNIALAAAVGRICGVSENATKKAFSAFRGLPGRQEKIAEIGGVSYYNDTTATMPDATVAALNTIKPGVGGKTILMAGGTDKKLDFGEMAREISKRVGMLILLPGDATRKLKFKTQNAKCEIFDAKSMKEAVKIAYENSRKGDVVILSPGAASFGLFKNEFDRGGQFVKEVMKLKSRVKYQKTV